MEPQVLDDIAEDAMVHVTDVINDYLANGCRVGVLSGVEGSWFDIGEFGSLEETLKHLEQK